MTGPLQALRSRPLRDLHRWGKATPVGLERQLQWVLGALEAKSSQITQFLKLRDELQETLLIGDSEQSLRLLDQIDAHCGPSLWSISTRIGVTHIFSGLEAQKEWVSELQNVPASPRTLFFAFWWSVRAEDDTSPDRFISDTVKRVRRWDLDIADVAHLDYQLCNIVPDQVNEEYLLNVSERLSIVDLYDSAIEISKNHIVHYEPRINSLYLNFIETLASIFNDPTLHKLHFLCGNPSSLEYLLATDISLQETALQKQPSLDENSEQESSTGIENAAAAIIAGAAKSTPYQGALWDRLKTNLADLSERGTAASKAQTELLKISLQLGRLPLGRWCRAIFRQSRGLSLAPEPTTALLRFLETPYLEPNALPAIPPDMRGAYQQRLHEEYGKASPAVAAAELLSGMPAAAPETLGILRTEFLNAARLQRAFQDADYATAYTLALQELGTQLGGSRIAIEASILSQLRQGNLRGVISSAVEYYLNNPASLSWLPVEEMKSIAESDFRKQSNPEYYIELVLLYDLLSKFNARDQYNSQKSYACEDLLSSMGIDRPSLIDLNNFPASRSILIYFLREICVPNVLKLSTAFGSEKELEDERIEVCSMLATLDAENSETYQAEARSIVRGRTVRTALRELQKSKISIDEDALRALVYRELGEDYDRYQTLISSGINAVNDSYRSELLKALETGFYPKSLFDVPTNEASSLLAKIITRFYHECSFNAEHGFDCYLSLRIRHGTLSGLLRGPVSHENLVTRKDTHTSEYKDNIHWPMLLAEHLDEPIIVEIEERLKRFSRDYDAIISNVTDNCIQIMRDDKPSGLFNFTLQPISIYGLATEIKPGDQFSLLIDKCLLVFWSTVDVSLKNVRTFIESSLKRDLIDCFDALENDVLRLSASDSNGSTSSGMIGDAIRRARGEVLTALETMQEWFEMPTSTNSLAFTIGELADIGLATIKKFYRNFDPKLTVSANEDVPALVGGLHIFSDIFFVLFENIYEHSDLISPAISIAASIDGGRLRVRVQNEVDNPSRHIERVNKAKERISSGAYRSAVRKEGGTGLPKLAKLIKDETDRSLIEFGLDSEHRFFYVEFSLSFTPVASSVSSEIDR